MFNKETRTHINTTTLRKKCPYLDFFGPKGGETEQKTQFSRSVIHTKTIYIDETLSQNYPPRNKTKTKLTFFP